MVRQRLKLAAVSPKLMALYRKGEMTLDQLMAFTVSDDHAAQEAAWFDAPEWQRSRHAIRQRLTAAHVQSGRPARALRHRRGLCGGGGRCRHRPVPGRERRLSHRSRVARPARDEKLEREAEAVRQEGWKWVEIMPDFAFDALRRLRGNEGQGAAACRRNRQKALAKAEARSRPACANSDELDDDEAERLDALEAEIAALSRTPLSMERPAEGAGRGHRQHRS